MRERTGWAARPGKQLVGSALVAIRDGRHWRRLVVAVRGGGRWRRLVVVIHFLSALTSFVAVHAVVVRGFRGRWSSFACCRVIGALSCRLRVVVSFARCRVVCAMSCHLRVFVVFVRRSWRLLSFVDGWDLVSRWA